MSYATQLLARGEEVVFESRPHWFSVVGRTWLWLVAAVLQDAILLISRRTAVGGLPSTGAGGTGEPLDPDQALDRGTALNMHTKGSAYQLNQESTTGTIEIGKLADIQILDVDASVVSPQRLAVANVVRTFVGGKTTWDATSPGWKATPAKRQQVADAAARASRDVTGCSCVHPG